MMKTLNKKWAVALGLLFVTGLTICTEASGLEHDIPLVVSQPNYRIKLLQNSKFKPALAVLLESDLYFTDRIGTSVCRGGSHLYRYSLLEKKEQRMVSIPCVLDLKVIGNTLFVVHQKTLGGRVDIATLQGDKLKPSLQEALRSHAAARSFLIDQSEFPEDVQYQYQFTFSPNNLFVFNVFLERDIRTFVNVFSLKTEQKLSAHPKLLPIPSQPIVIATGEDKILVAFEQHSFAQIALLKFDGEDVSFTTELYGKMNSPVDLGDVVSPDEWSISAPRYPLDVPGGFFITDQMRTSKAVWYFSQHEELFYRVPISAKGIGGLSFVEGALLVSKPMLGEVHCYGPDIPFSSDEVDPSQIEENPYLNPQQAEPENEL